MWSLCVTNRIFFAERLPLEGWLVRVELRFPQDKKACIKPAFGFVETARVEPRPSMETPYDQALIGVGPQYGCPDRCLDNLVSSVVFPKDPTQKNQSLFKFLSCLGDLKSQFWLSVSGNSRSKRFWVLRTFSGTLGIFL